MEAKIKILIAEHDDPDIELILHELQKNELVYVWQVVKNEQDYIHALGTFIPDIILADYTFPSFDGPTAFKLREAIATETPFIFVSGTIGEERSIELIRSGVTDYCLKDNLLTLNYKINRALKESETRQQKILAEQALILSEKRLARAQQMAQMGNWELNLVTNDLSWSDGISAIFGLLPGQNSPSFESVLSLIHPKDLDIVLEKVTYFRDCLCNASITYRIVCNDGSTRYIFMEGKPEYDANGKAIGVYGTAQDVTKMVVLENKLTEERQMRQKEIANAVLTAHESERSNIGNELNENLNQNLDDEKLYIQLSGKQKDKSDMYVKISIGLIQDVMESMRKISKTLIIPATHMISLSGNIRNLIHDLSLVHPITIEFHKNDLNTGLLHEKLQISIFRIVQEQLNNILLHANATRAEINLSRQNNEVILHISDNGEGWDTEKEKSGVGIINIRTRASLHDGKVTIVSAPGRGYQLKVAMSVNVNFS